MSDDLAPGLYEQVLTDGLAAALAQVAHSHAAITPTIDTTEASHVLAAHLKHVLEGALQRIPSGPDRLARQVAVCNQLLMLLEKTLEPLEEKAAATTLDLIQPHMLLALVPKAPLAVVASPPRPSYSLNETHLLVNARNERHVGYELAREIASADSIDLLCSFLLWSGYCQMRPALTKFFQRPGAQLRVLTTVYMGATHARVIDALHGAGAKIRISYDTRRTRLHAKAWLIHRRTGFSTAYIGSSNLSASALTEGLEWNVRVGTETPLVLNKFAAAFEGYWNDPAFEPYDPARDGERLRAALSAAKGGGLAPTFFDLQPHLFQKTILERLAAERELHGRFRNLVVAATGTGKTVIAAFDFRALREQFHKKHNRQPRLLFIAHRREILRQARDVFRQVLRDGSFGELLVDGRRASSDGALFASVQSLSSVNLEEVAPGAWDVVIVDEFHHAAAPSYAKWLKHLQPWVLLGLTATPERADGEDVLAWFDGHTTVELRLWDAIEQGLLVPFRYFALRDSVDLTGYWKRDRHQFDLAALDRVLTGHHARARQVLSAVHEYVDNPFEMKAIGFCVSRDHARFMAQQFEAAGLRADTALGDDDDRDSVVRRLAAGELQAVFTVDVLSEGVDIPEVDTVLLLRPTDSATVFIQQLGRGLRLHAGKRCLTVLDLVASPDRDFRVERRFQSLLGASRREVLRQVEEGFPLLPAGCSIQLTEDAHAVIVNSLKEAIRNCNRELTEVVRRLGPTASLRQVLDETHLSLTEFYKSRTLTGLKREAGTYREEPGPDEVTLDKTIPRLVGFDDVHVIQRVRLDMASSYVPKATLEWQLILVVLYPELGFTEPQAALQRLWAHPAHLQEIAELLECSSALAAFPQIHLPELDLPLRLHCHYQRKQIETALTAGLRSRLANGREGVWYVDERKVDALFVQLIKSEKNFSPSTMYRDYAISPDRFHWQSQATTAARHKKGQRHIEHVRLGITPLLFVRISENDERGETNPYLFLGPVQYVCHSGEKPMSIEWAMETPLPAAFFEAARVAV